MFSGDTFDAETDALPREVTSPPPGPAGLHQAGHSPSSLPHRFLKLPLLGHLCAVSHPLHLSPSLM